MIDCWSLSDVAITLEAYKTSSVAGQQSAREIQGKIEQQVQANAAIVARSSFS
jgi:hypothetical protein